MEKRLVEGANEVVKRLINSEYEDIFMESNQMVQCGEQALRITDKTKESLNKYEAQFRQATVMGLKGRRIKTERGRAEELRRRGR